MLPPIELERIAGVCTGIADEVADNTGFVAIRSLLSRFQASLVVRPMLVEGMLASIDHTETGANVGSRWAVLVDSETYRVSERDIESESSIKPLPTRLRNTIAHELVHALAFRPSEFGVQLKSTSKNGETSEQFVRDIEKHTEQFSPLLLWPEKVIRQLVTGKREPLTVEMLVEARRSARISRYVLINRLSFLNRADRSGLLNSWALRNLGIGIAEWASDGKSVIRSWPIFCNFDRNIVPTLLRKIANQDRLPAEAVFQQQDFAMCGGSAQSVTLLSDAGTAAHPNLKKLALQISIETGTRTPGREFFFVVHAAAS